MSRVFRMEDWAGVHETQTSKTGSNTLSHHSDEAQEPPHITPRKRRRSLPLGSVSDFSDHFRNLTMSSRDSTREEGKRDGGLRGFIRRASVSIKAKSQRRHSRATEDRPDTAWHKLRQAASFSRHSRFLSGTGLPFESQSPVESCDALPSPIPGNGAAPPIIPRGTAGAAARRQAAAQNEFFGRSHPYLMPDENQGDRESGIGITVTTNEPATYIDTSISRVVGVDFVENLPIELVYQILSHLDHKDLIRAAKTSRRWACVSHDPQVWRQSFVREKSKTYAMSRPILPGAGLGIPKVLPDKDWKDIYRIREELEENWREGSAAPVYLSGHLDSIYCVQFDE